jgi:outer membrane protein OmpA-like peptidoglycan-associated protein
MRSLCLAVWTAVSFIAADVHAGIVTVDDDRLVVNGRVHFQTGNATLATDSSALLDEVAAAFTQNADIDFVVIEGHTDSVGDPEKNRQLSEARARAVVDALVKRGVAPGRLKAKGFGDTIPVATNDTAAGREKNRRVEFTILVRAGQSTQAATPLAKLAARFNVVDAKAPEEPAWQAGKVGLPLYRAWRVNTKARSSADVAFRDTSKVHLRESTLIVIFGDNAYERKDQRRATLESGTLVSRIDELLGGAPLVVDTPATTAELGKGRAVVSTSATSSLVSNHKGDKVRVRGKKKKVAPEAAPEAVTTTTTTTNEDAVDAAAVDVPEGMGTRIVAGSAPEQPRPLPQAPTLPGDLPPTTTWRDGKSTLRFGVDGGADASALLFDVKDTAGAQVFQTQTAGTIKAVEVQGLPAGVYTLTVSAVDAIGLESLPLTSSITVEPAPTPAPTPPTVVAAAPPAPVDDGFCTGIVCPVVIGGVVVVGVAAAVGVMVYLQESAP